MWPMAYGHNSKTTSLLTKVNKDQLSSWIGKKCQFELLYKISRDGCCSETFHNICDQKGPTVSILYNTEHTYGGFLARSWTSSGNFIYDPSAFLFILSHHGVKNPKKFPVTDPAKAAFAHINFGPTFGDVSGRDMHPLPQFPHQLHYVNSPQVGKGHMQDSSTQPHLISFKNTVYLQPHFPRDESDEEEEPDFPGEFPLNGEVYFGVHSNGQYMNINDVKNMYFYDLEVYAVKSMQLC